MQDFESIDIFELNKIIQIMTSLRFPAILILCFSISSAYAQYEVKPVEGYTPQIGLMVDMLEELKERLTEDVKDLDQEQLDFLFDDKANSIGDILLHIMANESYYQVESLEGRSWTEEEEKLWGTASDMGSGKFKGKPIEFYLDLWDELRKKTLEDLKSKDDEWFASQLEEGVNYHWVWFHVLEHQAAHMGQIALIKNRLPE